MGGVVCAASAVAGYAVRGRSSAIFGPSVYRGSAVRRAVALTFDDGPSEGTSELLELLDRYKARATFFQCGHNVLRLPSIARAVRKAGHEIGNHSYSHPAFHFRSPGFILKELGQAQSAIRDVTGSVPTLFRAPFGIRWFGLRRAQRELGLLGVMWTVIGRDWKYPAARVASRVLNHAQCGAIICLHDGRELVPRPDIGVTLQAVRQILPALRERGFRFQTVSQLICPTN